MLESRETCWTLVRDAAAGDLAARSLFAENYFRGVRSWFVARWNQRSLAHSVDDAIQDVFVDCLREQGALQRVEPSRGTPFRGFLYGVCLNVARRYEERDGWRSACQEGESRLERIESPATPPSRSFDRAWGRTLLAGAKRRLAESTDSSRGLRQLELLRLRFSEDLPVREIARQWGEEAHRLHHELARAKDAFQRALREEIAFHHSDHVDRGERELERLLSLFQ